MDKKQASGVHQAQAAQAVSQVQKTDQVQKAQQAARVDPTNKTEKAALNKVRGENTSDQAATAKAMDPVSAKQETSKTTGMLTKMLGDMEKGQGVMDKLISGGLNGKNFNSSELLSLQAGMYKYTQELELTGKVVEKATSGLKDTLKTQV
ncbi:MAG: ATP-dependent helicase HrpB [Myxococcaceae bacterium]